MTLRRVLVTINLLALLIGAVVVRLSQSQSPLPECEPCNCCDARVFRGVAELLGDDAVDVYQWQALADWWAQEAGQAPELVLPFAYPPPALPLFRVQGLGTPRQAIVATAALGMALYLGAAGLLGGGLLAVVAGAGGWSFFSAWLGQTGLVLGAAGGLLLWGLRTGRWGVEGVALAVLCLKPQYGLYVVLGLAVAKRWRPLGVAAGTLAGLGLLSAGLYGPEQWEGWLRAVTGGVSGAHPALDFAFMSSWFALVPGGGPGLAQVGLALFAVGVLPVLWWWARRPAEQALGASIALALLLAPHGHPYDLGLWLVPAVTLQGRCERRLLALGLLAHGAIWTGTRALLPAASAWLAFRCHLQADRTG